jgi:cell division transport system permease protein
MNNNAKYSPSEESGDIIFRPPVHEGEENDRESLSRQSYERKLSLKEIWAESQEILAAQELSIERKELLKNYKLYIRILSQRCGQMWKTILAEPLTSIVTTLTITTVFFLLSALILFVQNLNNALSMTNSEITLTLYMRENASQEVIQSLFDEIKSYPDVKEVKKLDKEEVFSEFKRSLGKDSSLLEGLDKDNPLPSSIEITFRENLPLQEIFGKYEQKFSSNEHIEFINYNRGLIAKIEKGIEYIRIASALSVTTILFITGFVIACIIRLALYAHRDEIEIMKLVGATNSFIRLPYVMEGTLQGLLGAILSNVLLFFCFEMLKGFLMRDEILKGLVESISFLSFLSLLIICLLGALVGMIGSYRSVDLFLRSK